MKLNAMRKLSRETTARNAWIAFGGLAALAIIFMTILGRFFLETLELYMPRAAVVCLSYLFGMGLAGVALELLAIPWMLGRFTIALTLGLLLLILMVFARRRARRFS